MSISLGKKRTPLNFKKWEDACINKIGRIVPIDYNNPQKLTKKEMAMLGFTMASNEIKE